MRLPDRGDPGHDLGCLLRFDGEDHELSAAHRRLIVGGSRGPEGLERRMLSGGGRRDHQARGRRQRREASEHRLGHVAAADEGDGLMRAAHGLTRFHLAATRLTAIHGFTASRQRR